MIAELGLYAFILGLCLATLQCVISSFSARGSNALLLHLTRRTAVLQCIVVTISFAGLAYALVTNDFTVAYVANNSNRALPVFYRFCALWGGHEGSLLLWLWVLSLWTAAVALFSRRLPQEISSLVLAVLAIIAIGFYLFLLLTSNPFARLLPSYPLEGADLNPLLQDPGLALHPPVLYLGYVGFAVSFAFAVSVLITGKIQSEWVSWVRPWTLLAWCFLTVGIVMGSWWAYRELGWGGWWFWDPVENASLLPWLAATALLHALAVSEKRQTFYGLSLLLALLTFCLSLLGTFLVRSGVLISVHSFAQDPQRGLYLLVFLFAVVGVSLILYAVRAHKIINTVTFSLKSRETFLLANNLILLTAMMTVLLGTLYPLIMQVLNLGTLSVGAPYFNTVFIPLMLPLLLLMGFGPQMSWRDTQMKGLLIRFALLMLALLLLIPVMVLLSGESLKALPLLGLLIACWALFQNANLIKIKSIKQLTGKQWGMILAHSGVAIMAIGIIIVSTYSQQRDVSMQLGDQVILGDYSFDLAGIHEYPGPNYQALQAKVTVSKQGKAIATLYPELRTFEMQQISTSKSAIAVNLFRDLYVALARPLAGNAWALRVYDKPFVRWIWAGGLLIALGGLLALSGALRFKAPC